METTTKQFSILVVDDEPVARRVLSHTLGQQGHAVVEAEDGSQALGVLETTPVDMVISDIQMPGMSGFELLAVVKERYPAIRRVLVTAYDIDGYLSLVKEQDVGNILPKGQGMPAEDVAAYIASLLTADVFGLERYFAEGSVHSAAIRSYDQAQAACAVIVESNRVREPLFLEMAIDELISNAVFHGILSGVPRSEWNDGYQLDGECVEVSWARDERKVGVSVVDPRGNLRKVDVLKWLDGPLAEREGSEEHGRGLLLVRRLIDRFIINIRPGETTECIILQYHEKESASGHKPLLVHEI